jgi:hypothetical protein
MTTSPESVTVETARAVVVEVDADIGALGDDDALVDDRPADLATAADFDIVHHHGVGDLGVAAHADLRS